MDRNINHIRKDARDKNAGLGREINPYPILATRKPFSEITQADVRMAFDCNPLTGTLTRKSTGENAIRNGGGFGGKLYVAIGLARHAAEKVIWLWLHGEHQKTVNFRNSKRDFRAENLFVADK